MKLSANEGRKWVLFVQNILQRYYTENNLQKRSMALENCDNMRKICSRGGLFLPRGVYCRSLLRELWVTNSTRGKILKKEGGKKPDFYFYFDENGKLVLARRLPDTCSETVEWIGWEENTEFSICNYTEEDEELWGMICVAQFSEEGKILNNAMLEVMQNDSTDQKLYFDLIVENYKYNGELLETGKITRVNNPLIDTCYQDDITFNFIYNSDCELQGYCIDKEPELYRIPGYLYELFPCAVKKENDIHAFQKNFTAAIKKAIAVWKKADISAISVFINHDDEVVTDLALSYYTKDIKSDDDFEDSLDLNEEVDLQPLLREFVPNITWNELMEIITEIFADMQRKKIIYEQFEKNIPIVIHGYEYTDEEANATKKANPNGEVDSLLKKLF